MFLSCPGELCSCHELIGCVLVMSWWVVFLSCPGGLCSCHVLVGCVLVMS